MWACFEKSLASQFPTARWYLDSNLLPALVRVRVFRHKNWLWNSYARPIVGWDFKLIGLPSYYITRATRCFQVLVASGCEDIARGIRLI